MSDVHVCAARGCTKRVPTRLLMCGPHWRLVPKPVQSRVWDAYADWQRGRPDALRALREAQLAATAAVGDVAAGRPALPGMGG